MVLAIKLMVETEMYNVISSIKKELGNVSQSSWPFFWFLQGQENNRWGKALGVWNWICKGMSTKMHCGKFKELWIVKCGIKESRLKNKSRSNYDVPFSVILNYLDLLPRPNSISILQNCLFVKITWHLQTIRIPIP